MMFMAGLIPRTKNLQFGTGVICLPIPCVTPAVGRNSVAILCRPFPCPLAGAVKQGTASESF